MSLKKQAIELFNQGKETSFDLVSVLNTFQMTVGTGNALTRALLELLLASAYADGHFSAEEKMFTSEVCAHLGITVSEFKKTHARVEQQAQFRQHHHGSSEGQLSDKRLLKAAYGTIGVSESTTDADIKRAYRKLMSKNHPDKLVSQGVPDEMIEFAKQRTQEIQSAYELIKKSA